MRIGNIVNHCTRILKQRENGNFEESLGFYGEYFDIDINKSIINEI